MAKSYNGRNTFRRPPPPLLGKQFREFEIWPSRARVCRGNWVFEITDGGRDYWATVYLGCTVVGESPEGFSTPGTARDWLARWIRRNGKSLAKMLEGGE